MSTRSVTIVRDDGEINVAIYRHCDGYPSGMGKDICLSLEKFLKKHGKNRILKWPGLFSAALVRDLPEEEVELTPVPDGWVRSKLPLYEFLKKIGEETCNNTDWEWIYCIDIDNKKKIVAVAAIHVPDPRFVGSVGEFHKFVHEPE